MRTTLTTCVIALFGLIGVVMLAVRAEFAMAAGPPQLDVRLSCRAADRAFPEAGADKPRADMQSCLDDERTARDELVKAWPGFSSNARTLCTGMNRTGGPPSYVELLTCLEVMRAAGKTP